ncbi:MAG TPA: hypothetical protein VGN34_17235 [Ktedonobacteraceae bacterium]|jgi:uncharacterized protein (DUF488 family)
MTPEQLQKLRAYHHQQEEPEPLQPPADDHPIGSLETIGYTEEDAAQRVAHFMRRSHTVLLDIRFSPRSRLWVWNGSALQAVYGSVGELSRYVQVRALGNVNFKHPDLPIMLYQPEPPVQALAQALSDGYSFLLLCTCKRYETCHRKVVYDLIQARLAELVGEAIA